MNIADEFFYNGRKYIKLANASERLGLSKTELDRQCYQKKLEAERIEDQWFILESALSKLPLLTNHLHPVLFQSSLVTLTKMSGALTGLIGVLVYFTLITIVPHGFLTQSIVVPTSALASANFALERSVSLLDTTATTLSWGADQVYFSTALTFDLTAGILVDKLALRTDELLTWADQGSMWFIVQTTSLPFSVMSSKEQLLTAATARLNFSGVAILEWITEVIDQVFSLAAKTIISLGNLWTNMMTNWTRFFNGKSVSTPAVVDPGLSQIQADIKDIKSGISEILRRLPVGGSSVKPSTLPAQGVVVVPATSSTPQSLKDKVAEMFSDKVNVNVDPSGKAGVVTPIFRDHTGEDYIFVLTPVKQ
ncbi:MAG: hypothetical protein HYV76_02285 [Candidatus Vogelbacteria bacterium]|nr:hypothetical protein [Candidatus Vogelbacteria bacterium]